MSSVFFFLLAAHSLFQLTWTICRGCTESVGKFPRPWMGTLSPRMESSRCTCSHDNTQNRRLSEASPEDMARLSRKKCKCQVDLLHCREELTKDRVTTFGGRSWNSDKSDAHPKLQHALQLNLVSHFSITKQRKPIVTNDCHQLTTKNANLWRSEPSLKVSGWVKFYSDSTVCLAQDLLFLFCLKTTRAKALNELG